jgi:hypothetical protein
MAKSGFHALVDVALLSAGSGLLLILASSILDTGEFAEFTVLLSAQAVLNLVIRAAVSEAAMFAPPSRWFRLSLEGVLWVLFSALLLFAQGTVTGLPLPLVAATSVWVAAYFTIDFSRSLPLRKLGSQPPRWGVLSGVAVLAIMVLGAIVLVFEGRVLGIWLGAAGVIGSAVYGTMRCFDGVRQANRQPEAEWAIPAPPRGRLILDAIFLQAGVQLALWAVGILGYEDFTAVMKVAQTVFIPISILTLALQTSTTHALSPNSSARALARSSLPFAIVSLVALLPLVLLVPSVEALLRAVVAANLLVFLPYVGLLSVTKFFDAYTNWGIVIARAVGRFKTSSIMRRTWGGANALGILGAPLLGDVSIGVALLALIAAAAAGAASMLAARIVRSHR